MGKVGKQVERESFDVTDDKLESFIDRAKSIAKKKGVSVAAVISARHTLELARRNDLFRAGGENEDENFAGIAEAISKLEK